MEATQQTVVVARPKNKKTPDPSRRTRRITMTITTSTNKRPSQRVPEEKGKEVSDVEDVFDVRPKGAADIVQDFLEVNNDKICEKFVKGHEEATVGWSLVPLQHHKSMTEDGSKPKMGLLCRRCARCWEEVKLKEKCFHTHNDGDVTCG